MTTETLNDTSTDTSPTGEDTALGTAAATEAGGEGKQNVDATNPDAVTITNPDGKKVDGEPAGEGAKADDAASEGAPEAYDTAAFTMPEGVEFDADGFAAVEPVLRDLNLSQDQAGKLMSAYAEKIVPLIQQRTAQQFEDAGAELRADLARQLQADPEVGGKKLDESRSFAAKAIAHFIPKADERSQFSTFLNESGLGNHPLLMRLVTGAGRAISEASTPAGETATGPLSNSQLFYGKKG